MPLRADTVISYVNGSRYKNLLESKINATDLKKYSEFIVPSDKPYRKYISLFAIISQPFL